MGKWWLSIYHKYYQAEEPETLIEVNMWLLRYEVAIRGVTKMCKNIRLKLQP